MIVLKLIVIGSGIGIVLVFIGMIVAGPPPQKSVSERIEEECEREYGRRGALAVSECRVRLGLRYLADAERQKEERAYNRVR